MQKTLRINLLARNRLIKKTHAEKLTKTKEEWTQWHRGKMNTEQTQKKYIKEERKARREDWMAGPLAPNRNSGTEKGVYGTLEIEAIRSPKVPDSVAGVPETIGFDAVDFEGKDRKKRFVGRTIVGNVVEGDRVVVVHGNEAMKGVIGTVMSVEDEPQEVRLRGMNLADVRIPPQNQQLPTPENPEPAKFQSHEVPIPMSHIRLVTTALDQDTGLQKDVIVRHVHAGGPYAQRRAGSNLPAHTRYITGSEAYSADGRPIQIPWPQDNVEELPKQMEVDTDRKTVEETDHYRMSMQGSPLGYFWTPSLSPIKNNDDAQSWEPKQVNAYNAAQHVEKRMKEDATSMSSDEKNLIKAGLASFTNEKKANARQERLAKSIMNELRDKTDIKNFRHDDSEWVKRKILEDARAIWWQSRQVITPQTAVKEQQIARKHREREFAVLEQLDPRYARAVESGVEEVARRKLLALNKENMKLVREVQAQAARFSKADPRLQKKLGRMVV